MLHSAATAAPRPPSPPPRSRRSPPRSADRRSAPGRCGVRSLIRLKASQVRRRPAQLRLHYGRVTLLDVTAAKAHPGIVEGMTPANRPPLALDPDAKLDPFMFRLALLPNDRARYAGQPLAVVIAETLEAAREGAVLLSPRSEPDPPPIALDGNDSFIPPAIGPGYVHSSGIGGVNHIQFTLHTTG